MTVNILKREQSFQLPLLLEASAGTGKTFFISHFVIRSILDGIPLDEIAAITFTRKAASELKERILSLIDTALSLLYENESGDDRLLIEYLEPYLENSTLREKGIERLLAAKCSSFQAIGTIHHFASLLLKQYSSKVLTISPDLIEPFAKIAEEVLQEISPSPFLKFTLANSLKSEKGWQKWIKALFERKNPSYSPILELRKKNDALLDKGSALLSLLENDPEGDLISLWIDEFKGAKALLAKVRELPSDLCRALKKEILFADLLDLHPEFLLLTEKKKKLKEISNPVLTNFLENSLLPYFFEITNEEFALDLFKEMIDPKWQNYRLEEQLVSFDDLLEELYSLIQDGSIRKRIQKAYPLLIVDEFQDTDPLQWKIISELYLNEEAAIQKGLLLVGDPKQSIYGFRKADLYTYLQAAYHPKLSRLTLTCNFRSNQALLHSLNLLFSSEQSKSWSWIPRNKTLKNELLQDESLQRVDLIPVPVLEGKSKAELKETLQAAIEIGVCARSPSREKSFPGARWESEIAFPYIINEIKNLALHSVPLSEICVLIEDRYQGFRLKAELEKAMIPAEIDRSFDVRENSELFGLAKLLFQAIANPESRARVLSLIFSPLYQMDARYEVDSVAVEVQRNLKSLQKLFIEDRTLFFADLLQKPLWNAGGALEAGIFHLDELLYEGASSGFWLLIEKLITSEECQKISDIHSFESHLNSWQKGLGLQEEWHIPRESGREAVKLMTCFAAKGLEFDAVFALSLTSRISPDAKDPAQEKEEIAEKMRQLYVAMTRPKLKLYLLVALEEPIQLNRLMPSPIELFFSQMLEGNIDLDTAIQKVESLSFEKLHRIVELLTLEGASIALKKIDPSSLSQNSSLLPPIEKREKSITLSLPHKQLSLEMPSLRPLEDLSFTGLSRFSYKRKEQIREISNSSNDLEVGTFPTGKEIGDLIHRLFHQLFSKGLFQNSKKEERLLFASGFLQNTQLKDHFDALMEKIERWLIMPLFDGRSISDLKPHEVQSEMDFFITVPKGSSLSKKVQGSIDACVTIDHKVWILDWKTHFLPANTSNEQLYQLFISEGYDLQARIYSLALHDWLSLFPDPPKLEKVLFCFLHAKGPLEVIVPFDSKEEIEEEILLLSQKRDEVLQ